MKSISILLCIIFIPIAGICANTNISKKKNIDQAIGVIEARYRKACFRADFYQESTLKAMDMTDTAQGHALFKWPGMMHWTYENPEKQYIITNGDDLWIYRPSDHQVMVGKSPDYFGKGKGGSFLTDIDLLRSSFDISWAIKDDPCLHKTNDTHAVILLIPKKKNPDFDKLYIVFNPQKGDIIEIITFNSYQDRTRIQFKNVKFNESLKDSEFSFTIPDGTDVVHLAQ